MTYLDLVSFYFNGNSHSSIFDLPSTSVVQCNLVKVLSFYYNYLSYACRFLDLVRYVGRTHPDRLTRPLVCAAAIEASPG